VDPTSISTLAHGQRLLQWQTGGQHLAVLFTPDNRFLQITHRHGVWRPFELSGPRDSLDNSALPPRSRSRIERGKSMREIDRKRWAQLQQDRQAVEAAASAWLDSHGIHWTRPVPALWDADTA
jgi:hypothetical protein